MKPSRETLQARSLMEDSGYSFREARALARLGFGELREADFLAMDRPDLVDWDRLQDEFAAELEREWERDLARRSEDGPDGEDLWRAQQDERDEQAKAREP